MAKARRGWGGVYRRTSDGLWVGTVELGRDHRGRRRRRAVYGRTKRDALVKLEQARRDTDQNREPVDLRLTTGEWLDKWLSDQSDELSPGSLMTCRYAVEACIKPELGQIRLAKSSLTRSSHCCVRVGRLPWRLHVNRSHGQPDDTSALRSRGDRHGFAHRRGRAGPSGCRPLQSKSAVRGGCQQTAGSRLSLLPELLSSLDNSPGRRRLGGAGGASTLVDGPWTSVDEVRANLS